MESTINLARDLKPMLRGKIDGREHHGRLCSLLGRIPRGQIVLLDFADVEELSGSWIAAALVRLLEWAAHPEHDLYPVLTNIRSEFDKKWEDEFELVAEQTKVVFVVRDTMADTIHRLIGILEAPLLRTLRAVHEVREVTGAGLKRLFPNESILATGWSNRLRDLYSLRLVRRSARGRELIYTPALEVDFDGARSPGETQRELPTQTSAGGSGQ